MENTIVNQNAAAEQPSVLDLLLGENVINVAKNLPTAKFEVPRLSEAAGAPVIFTLQALPYGRVQDISRLDQDAELQILLAGCIDPDLKSTPLQHKFGGITPAETLKAMLLPGEIADLSREVERLSGYRRATIEKVKNA